MQIIIFGAGNIIGTVKINKQGIGIDITRPRPATLNITVGNSHQTAPFVVYLRATIVPEYAVGNCRGAAVGAAYSAAFVT